MSLKKVKKMFTKYIGIQPHLIALNPYFSVTSRECEFYSFKEILK